MAAPHDVLGVARDASPEELKTAYKRLAMKHHPDRGGDTEQFQRITQAFEALKSRASSVGLFDEIFERAAKKHRETR